MYLHIGNGNVVQSESIIGIFDLDITSQSYITREYLTGSERTGIIVNAAENEIPKSFVICEDKGESKVYLAQPASATLHKRSELGR